VDEARARLDGLDARSGAPLGRPASTSAALADLLGALVRHVDDPLERVLARARDGAYLSSGQFARELAAAEPPRRRFWRR
jgi:hypothetical protein